jgi:hypothetical protein
VQVKDIQNFVDSRLETVSFFHDFPVRSERGGSEYVIDHLFYPGEETHASCLFGVEIVLCKLHFEVVPAEEGHKEEDGQDGIEDSAHEGKGIE